MTPPAILVVDGHRGARAVFRRHAPCRLLRFDRHCDARGLRVWPEARAAAWNRRTREDDGSFLAHAVMAGEVSDVLWIRSGPGPVEDVGSVRYAPVSGGEGARCIAWRETADPREAVPFARTPYVLDVDWDFLSPVEGDLSGSLEARETALLDLLRSMPPPAAAVLAFSPWFSEDGPRSFEDFAERLGALWYGANVERPEPLRPVSPVARALRRAARRAVVSLRPRRRSIVSPDADGIAVAFAGPERREAWDALVASESSANVGHSWAYLDALEAAGLPAVRLVALDEEGRLRGLLPLARVRTPLGPRLDSLPTAYEAGPLGDAAVRRRLAEAALALAEVEGAALVLRAPAPLPGVFDERRRFAAVRVDLAGAPPAAAAARHARAAAAAGLAHLDEIDEEAFLDLHRSLARARGFVPLPAAFLVALRRLFGPRCRLLGAFRGGRPVAAEMLLVQGETWFSKCTGRSTDAPPGSDDWMLSVLAARARDEGARALDLGRSPVGSGALAFKEKFGTSRTLAYAATSWRRGPALGGRGAALVRLVPAALRLRFARAASLLAG